MDLFRQQVGYGRIGWVILLSIIGGIVYVSWTFFPMGVRYFGIQQATIALANQSLRPENASSDAKVRSFIQKIEEDFQVVLDEEDIVIDDEDRSSITVTVNCELPYQYPFTKQGRFKAVTIEAVASR